MNFHEALNAHYMREVERGWAAFQRGEKMPSNETLEFMRGYRIAARAREDEIEFNEIRRLGR